MTSAEADAMLARDTGWHLEYIKQLDEYQKRLLLGWKPKKPAQEQDAEIRRQIAMLTRNRRGR